MRENYLKKFHASKLEDIRGGLGIGTKVDWFDIDSEYTKPGNTNYESNAILFEEDKLHDKESDLEPNIVNEIKKIIEDPTVENKLDYLHIALRNIKILIIAQDGKYIIDRKVIGNQYNHLIIYVKENTNSTIYLKTISANDHSIATDFLDVIVCESSRAHFVDLRNYGNKYLIYSRKKVHLKDNSDIKWTNIEGTARLNITELRSIINGSNSGSIMNNIIVSKDSEYNIFTRTDHDARNTKSLMQCRAIMNNSKVIMRGLVYIDERASNSNGYQKNEMLMLDNTSRAISIPNLEIHNHEVRCTHGSSISKPDAEKLFYLQSRGLNHEDSKRLIVNGFYDVLLSEVPNGLKDNVSYEIEQILYPDEIKNS